ncbi:MAG TPA: hypothetical protein VGH97_02275 [Thermoanaerobaculia bacterium]|jgi:hypothetical protein
MRLRPLLLCALGVSFAASACKPAGDPVRATLDRMTLAAHARDAAAVAANLTADFQAADGSSRADDEQLLRRYFAAYESLDVRLEDVQIERAENTARVRLRAVMSGRPREVAGLAGLLPSSAKYDFDFRMSREGSSWKVAWASWTQAE